MKPLDRGFLSHIAHESDSGPCDDRRGRPTPIFKGEHEGPSGRAATKTRNISRKGAKHVLSDVEGAAKKKRLSFRPKGEIFLRSSHSLGMTGLARHLAFLAFLASLRPRSGQAWREQIPVLGNHGPSESLRKPRKLSTMVIQSVEKGSNRPKKRPP